MCEQPPIVQATEEALNSSPAGAALYLVLSGTSDAHPVKRFYEKDGLTGRPLFMGTPYAGWHEVMPYLVQTDPNGAFLKWLEQNESQDWGWAAISSASFEVVFAHCQSLIQVTMPSQKSVFFRFWDPRFLEPLVAAVPEQDKRSLMGPVERMVVPSGSTMIRPPGEVSPPQPYPWFRITQEVEKQLAVFCWQQLVDNTLAALYQFNATPLSRMPEPVARLKVERHLRKLAGGEPVVELNHDNLTRIHNSLLQDAAQA